MNRHSEIDGCWWLLWGIAGIIAIFSLSGCASTAPITRPVTITKNAGAIIQLPENPPRPVVIETPDVKKEKRDPKTVYVSDPIWVKPNTTWQAPQDGAWVWEHRDLHGILYALKEYPLYIGVLHGIIMDHNKRMGVDEDNQKWWQIWK